MTAITTIQLKKPTRKKLGELGTSKDSKDTIINMLLDHYREVKA